LQLIECIESIKSDVKKKMMLICALERCTKVTRRQKRENCVTQQEQISISRQQNFPQLQLKRLRSGIFFADRCNQLHPALPAG
jgi:hypothetical protein